MTLPTGGTKVTPPACAAWLCEELPYIMQGSQQDSCLQQVLNGIFTWQ